MTKFVFYLTFKSGEVVRGTTAKTREEGEEKVRQYFQMFPDLEEELEVRIVEEEVWSDEH